MTRCGWLLILDSPGQGTWSSWTIVLTLWQQTKTLQMETKAQKLQKLKDSMPWRWQIHFCFFVTKETRSRSDQGSSWDVAEISAFCFLCYSTIHHNQNTPNEIDLHHGIQRLNRPPMTCFRFLDHVCDSTLVVILLKMSGRQTNQKNNRVACEQMCSTTSTTVCHFAQRWASKTFLFKKRLCNGQRANNPVEWTLPYLGVHPADDCSPCNLRPTGVISIPDQRGQP